MDRKNAVTATERTRRERRRELVAAIGSRCSRDVRSSRLGSRYTGSGSRPGGSPLFRIHG
jgi:hypothetical protein